MSEMPISSSGFLSDSLEIEENIYLANKMSFDHAVELNLLCQILKEKFIPTDTDGQKIIAIAIFIKILNGYQAIILLAKKGLASEANILLRTILEALFLLKIICEDEEFHKKYITMDSLRRKKLIMVAQSNQYEVFDETRKMISEEFLKGLDDEINAIGVTPEQLKDEFRVEELSKRAKLHDLYEAVYRLGSDTVHTHLNSLTNYVKTDSNGKIILLYSGPNPKVDLDLEMAVNIMLTAIDSLKKTFNLGNVPEIDAFAQKILKERMADGRSVN